MSTSETSTRTRVVDSPKIWASMLTNKDYLTGLLTLDYSLKKHKTKYPLVVLYTDSIEPETLAALKRRHIPFQRIETLRPVGTPGFGKEDARWNEIWSKMQYFNLTEYDQIGVLDADMVVLQNMDELLDIELNPPETNYAATTACTCNPRKLDWYPKDWTPENCAFTKQHTDPDAAQTTGGDNHHGTVRQCNGGTVIVRPNPANFDAVVRKLNDPARSQTYMFTDQSLLEDTFGTRWVTIPYVYNAQRHSRYTHPQIWRDERVKNVHYIYGDKPWENREAEEERHRWHHERWWKVNDERKERERREGVDDQW